MDGFFGTDGIRDRVGSGRLAPANVRRIGRAIARFARERVAAAPRVLVGRDPRPSGPAILAALAEGMAAEGVVVEDGGVLPTPAVAWFTVSGGADLGLVITASHNPPEDNGIKVILPGGRKTSPEDEADLEARITLAPPEGVAATPRARADAVDRYVAAAVVRLSGGGRLDGLRLVIDCANGATMATARRILGALGAVVETPVGSDPAGAINDRCGTQHPEAWRAAVRDRRADGGLAFDGDGDRVLLCDATGEVLDGDPVLHLLASDLDARGALPGHRVVATVMSNFGLEQAAARRGLVLDRVPVGDRFVAARMRETGAVLGGEQSGHVLLVWDGALLGDGVVAGVAALQAARRLGLSLARCRSEVPRCPQVLKNVRVARRVPLEEAPAFLAAARAEEAALAGRGRVVIRYSGTEPLLRIMVEGPAGATVDAAIARLEQAAQTYLVGS
jgi:phosphoglucosamine mutase